MGSAQKYAARETRAAWSLAHGLTILELDGRFPPGADVDAAWVAGLGAIRAVLGGAVIRT